jgi:xylulokinase
MSATGGSDLTVGVDVGTSSVKAVAADGDGNIVARARVPHPWSVPAALQFQHDAKVAWYDGPRAALAALGDIQPRALAVASMVPSLTAVDADGVPIGPGLLYGDERGHTGRGGNPAETGELAAFLRWLAREYPDASGFWPAQAVANSALAGEGVISTTTAATAFPLFDWVGWDAERVAACGARVEQLPRIAVSGRPAGHLSSFPDAVLEPGTIDALGDQVVAGADREGDVLVLLGTTLITWAVVPHEQQVDGYFSIPHTAAGHYLFGGPSNAGGLFLDWVRRFAGEPDGAPRPDRVPVWAPYPRGERVPHNDPQRRAMLADLDLTHDAPSLRRAAFEASGFVARRTIEAASAAHGITPRRIVATGGGTRVEGWVRALADCTGLPVVCTEVPEGAALGSAFMARCAAGLEEGGMTSASRWARAGRTVDPDPAWVGPASDRYQRFLQLSA